MAANSIASVTLATFVYQKQALPYMSSTLIANQCQSSTVFVADEVDVPVVSSQPLAVRNEQTGQPAAGTPLEPEVVVTRV